MSATTALLRGRKRAEALMVDTCTVQRVASSSSDPETGKATVTYTTAYSGKCKVSEKVKRAIPRTVGEAFEFLFQLQIALPTSAVGVAANDIVTITASALDPDLVGRVFHVRELAHASMITARRYQAEEVTG